MPFFTTPLPETYLSITRRVARSALSSLFTLTTLPKEKTQVSFSGESGQSLIWNSKMKNFFRADENFNKKLGNYGKLMVEIKEETVEEHSLVMETIQDRYVPLFQSKRIHECQVKPVYDKTRITLSCTWRSENREDADIFRNDFRHHIADGRAEIPIEVQYLVLLPKPTMALLHHVYQLQENQAGYGVEFREWLAEGSFGNINQVSNLKGEADAFVIEERQIMVFGKFDFTTPPERNKKDQGTAHEVTFDFVIEYEKPIEVVTFYPLMVHNQLVHEMFHPKPAYDISRIPAHRDIFRYVSDKLHWSNKQLNEPNKASAITLPEYDTWIAQMKTDEVTLATTIIELDKEDLGLLLNIHDFEEVGVCQYSRALKRYLRIYNEFITDSRESPFFISVFEGNKRLDPSQFRLSVEGELRSIVPLDLRKQYHVVIGFLMDWRRLSDNAIRRLCSIPWMLDEFLQVLHPDYDKINWDCVNKNLKESQLQKTGDKATDFLRSQGHVFDKWHDPRWTKCGLKPIGRSQGWIKQWIKEFYLKHGRYPTDEEIDNAYRKMTPEMQHNFFGHADETELQTRYLYPHQRRQYSPDKWKWRVYRHVGFFTVLATPKGA